MDKNRIELTQSQKEQLQNLANMPDDQIDLSDAPEVTDWSGAIRGLMLLPQDERIKALKNLKIRRMELFGNGR